MNYGHQISNSSYSTSQIENDYAYLQSIGITRLRIAMPPYDGTSISNCEDMVTRALAHGFYVIWGVATSGTITSTVWSAWKSYVTSTLAPWAQTNGLTELCIGNEFELHVDGTTLTSTTVRSDLRALASTVKSNGFTGKVSYSTSILSTYRTPWISEGIGALDVIGWNAYDTFTNFNTRVGIVISAFGSATYISEFSSISNGQSDYASEQAYHDDVLNRVNSMRSNGVSSGYFFCFRDGTFGMPVNSFGLVQTSTGTNTGSNWAHYALNAISGKRLYASRAFGSPVQFGLGLMNTPAETVSPSESVALTGNSTLAPETVSLSDIVSLTGNSTLAIESVSLAESISLVSKTVKKYALRAFGSPVRYGIRTKYALRAFGSPVRYTINVHATNVPAESVLPSESVAFSGNTTFAPDLVALSENISQIGTFNNIIKRYALRTFGSPVHYRDDSTDNVSLAESISLQGSYTAIEQVALSETSTQSGSLSQSESVSLNESSSLAGNMALAPELTQLSESLSLAGSSTLAPESVSLAETLSQVGSSQFIENVQVREDVSLSGSSQFVESAQLSETLSLLGIVSNIIQIKKYALRTFGSPVQYNRASSTDIVSLTEQFSLQGSNAITPEQVALSETSSFTGNIQFIDSAQLREDISLAGSNQLAPDNVSLTELLTLINAIQLIENALLSENVSLASSMQIIENVSLNDLVALQGATVLAPEIVQLSELLLLTNMIQSIDNVQLSDTILFASSMQIIDNVSLSEIIALQRATVLASDTVQVSELLSLLGNTHITDNVQLSEIISTLAFLIAHAHGRGGAMRGHKRDGKAIVKGV